MEARFLFWIVLFETVTAAVLFLIYPRIMRRGLLFGVYVGPENAGSDAASAITRGWTSTVLVASAVVILAVIVGNAVAPGSAVIVAGPVVLSIAGAAAYLRAYMRARALGVEGAPAAAASLTSSVAGAGPAARTARFLPWIVLVVAVVLGCEALGYTIARYDELPQRMPTHFGISGKPDGWSQKSFGAVYTLPLLTLAMGVMLAVVTWAIARAKRALRYPAVAASLEAQDRFRAAMAWYMAMISITTTLLQTTLSIEAVRVAAGDTTALSPATMVFGAILFVVAIGGAIVLAIRFGQGGSRIEGAAASQAPLTNGLADNRCWKLGVFYVNREDPSFLVEHRFGLGYTLNFGNPKAVGVMIGFAVLILGLAIVAIVAAS